MNDDEKRKIRTFTDLHAWQKGHELVLEIYTITKIFPNEEKFALIDQLRRASVSVTSNIAEGFSRKSYKEKNQFYSMALGSLTEVQNQIIISKDIGYINEATFKEIEGKIITTNKLLNGLIKKTRNHDS